MTLTPRATNTLSTTAKPFAWKSATETARRSATSPWSPWLLESWVSDATLIPGEMDQLSQRLSVADPLMIECETFLGTSLG